MKPYTPGRHFQTHLQNGGPANVTVRLPIAVLPVPLPCPFCGSDDSHVLIHFEHDGLPANQQARAIASCDYCGAQAAPASTSDTPGDDELAWAAAHNWNRRNGKRGAK